MKRLMLMLLLATFAVSAQSGFTSGNTYTKDGITLYLMDYQVKPAVSFCARSADDQVAGFDVTFTFISNLQLYTTRVRVDYPRLSTVFGILRNGCGDMVGSKTAQIQSIEVVPLKPAPAVKF